MADQDLVEQRNRLARVCADNETDYQSRLQLAGVCAQLEDMEAVVRYCREAISLRPSDPDAHYNLALALQMLGRYSEADASYRSTIASCPTHAHAHLNLGSLLARVEMYPEALEYLEKASELNPELPEAHHALGLVLLHLKKFIPAAESLQKGVSLKPMFPEPNCLLGICKIHLQDSAGAKHYLDRALALRPGYGLAYFHRCTLGNEGAIARQPEHIADAQHEGNDQLQREARVGSCIDRALAYFSEQGTLADDTENSRWDHVLIYVFLQKKFGIPMVFDQERVDNILRRRLRCASPARDNFVLFRRVFDPGHRVPDEILDRQARLPIDGTTLQALYCDCWSSFSKKKFFNQLATDIGKGGYYTTHALVAMQWARENGCIDYTEIRELEERAVVRCLDHILVASEYDDLIIEALATIQYAGYHYLVQGQWIGELVSAQQADGGWLWSSDQEVSHPHPSVLALWALLEYAYQKSSVPWIGNKI